MTNGQEEPQSIGEALRNLREHRGRMAPRGRAGGDQTGGEIRRSRGAKVVNDQRDVQSQGQDAEKTGSELPDEGEEEARDVESLVDDRVERRGRDLKSSIRNEFADFKSDMLTWAVGILVTGLLTGLAGVAGLYYTLGSDWKDDVLRSLDNFRREIQADVQEIRKAGEARDRQIDRLEDRTDSLMRVEQ